MRSEGGRQYCMCVWGKLSTGAKNTVCGGGGTAVLYTRKDGVTCVWVWLTECSWRECNSRDDL